MVVFGGSCGGLLLTVVQLAWSHRESENDQVGTHDRSRRSTPASPAARHSGDRVDVDDSIPGT